LGCGGRDLTFPTEYQAVFLDKGQVFSGKLGDGPRQVEQDKREAKNLLGKRGCEWHAPGFMPRPRKGQMVETRP
jgi:hypothetical protein